jgi:hypothetical protein
MKFSYETEGKWRKEKRGGSGAEKEPKGGKNTTNNSKYNSKRDKDNKENSSNEINPDSKCKNYSKQSNRKIITFKPL